MRSLMFILSCLMNTIIGLNLALASETPLEKNAFTASLRSLFQSALPQSEVTIVGPLTLKVLLPEDGGKNFHTAHLDALYDLCVRDPKSCDAAVSYHVTDITTYYAHKDEPLQQEALRIAVRSSAYVEKIRERWGERAMAARPLVGDLWVVGAADLPTTIRMLKPEDIQTLNISAEQALTVAQNNTRADLKKSISDLRTAAVTDRKIMGFTGNAYMSSILALDDIWRDIAKSMGGRVIAMVPAPDVLMVARDDSATSASDLRQAGREVMDKSLHPLAGAVFRWSDKGWTVEPRYWKRLKKTRKIAAAGE
jgi:hypothetical protein